MSCPWFSRWTRCLHMPEHLMSHSLLQASVPLTGCCMWLEETTGPVTSPLWSSTTRPQTSGASFPQTWAMDAAMLVSLRFCVRDVNMIMCSHITCSNHGSCHLTLVFLAPAGVAVIDKPLWPLRQHPLCVGSWFLRDSIWHLKLNRQTDK